MKYLSETEFNKWALKMYKEYKKTTSLLKMGRHVTLNYTITYFSNGTTTIIDYLQKTVTISDIFKNKSGWSKCQKDDVFDAAIGIGIAWARYCNKEIPKICKPKKWKELVYGEKFRTKFKSPCVYTFINKMPNNDGYIVLSDNIPIIWEYTPDNLVYLV